MEDMGKLEAIKALIEMLGGFEKEKFGMMKGKPQMVSIEVEAEGMPEGDMEKPGSEYMAEMSEPEVDMDEMEYAKSSRSMDDRGSVRPSPEKMRELLRRKGVRG